ncbi:hypothetical protein [uncultured Imperialibacter sp.]|uniref:hypothetical protein n=1 Tax=uncultured Imperialibacter sp. TaxID=1672639 RepID=UPI0030DC4AC0
MSVALFLLHQDAEAGRRWSQWLSLVATVCTAGISFLISSVKVLSPLARMTGSGLKVPAFAADVERHEGIAGTRCSILL